MRRDIFSCYCCIIYEAGHCIIARALVFFLFFVTGFGLVLSSVRFVLSCPCFSYVRSHSLVLPIRCLLLPFLTCPFLSRRSTDPLFLRARLVSSFFFQCGFHTINLFDFDMRATEGNRSYEFGFTYTEDALIHITPMLVLREKRASWYTTYGQFLHMRGHKGIKKVDRRESL